MTVYNIQTSFPGAYFGNGLMTDFTSVFIKLRTCCLIIAAISISS